MVRIIDVKQVKEAIVDRAKKIERGVYVVLGINSESYEKPEQMCSDICYKLCPIGINKKRQYNSLEEMRECDNCSTDMRRKFFEAKPRGEEFTIEIPQRTSLSQSLSLEDPSVQGKEALSDDLAPYY